MAASSPYHGVPLARWPEITRELLHEYPVPRAEVVEIVLEQWASIFQSRVGNHGLRIGEHIFPKPQIMGDYLHELIPYEFKARYPDRWRRDDGGADKDLVYVPDPDKWSMEIKTSSHPTQVFGNRSYAQPGEGSRKSKSGFYLTVNFERWSWPERTPDGVERVHGRERTRTVRWFVDEHHASAELPGLIGRPFAPPATR